MHDLDSIDIAGGQFVHRYHIFRIVVFDLKMKVLNHLDGYSGEYDVNITLSVLNKDFKEKSGKSVYESQSINFTVMSSDKNTLACLREIGVI